MVPVSAALAAGAFLAAPGAAGAAAPACAQTTDGVPTATAGHPCWTEVKPYPFGTDGNPVDTTSPACKASDPGPNWNGDIGSSTLGPCYLQVTSMAFRAWNRGLAATAPIITGGTTTAFGVWLFNGSRWFPDPTFPGQATCPGNTVLWAGKRDYWLIGAPSGVNWPALCRFDGVGFEWQPLAVPNTALNRLPTDSNGKIPGGAITSGACYSWDSCWFFGSLGIVLHWDGTALRDATPDLLNDPWLGTDYTAAAARTDAAGSPFGVAVGSSGGFNQGLQLPPQPDGSAPPQMVEGTFSSGSFPSPSTFQPLAYTPPTAPQPGDPYRTDLVAVDFGSDGTGWVAGDPVGYRPIANSSSLGTPSPLERRINGREPAPLVRLRADGTPLDCPGAPPERFTYSNLADHKDAFLWGSMSVFPSGDALAAGQIRPASTTGTLNDDGQREPGIVQVSCTGTTVVTRFRLPNPFVGNSSGGTVPADRLGAVTAVAANAANDAWAATSYGSLQSPNGAAGSVAHQRPHLYRLTDGESPQAPAGDDNEPRPVIFQADPPIVVEEPPVYVTPPTHVTVVTKPGKKTVTHKKLKPSIYDPTSRLRHIGSHFILELSFRVRRPVTIGLQALRRGRVVASSGLKHFSGRRGTLAMTLDPRHWPTKIRFVTPHNHTAAELGYFVL